MYIAESNWKWFQEHEKFFVNSKGWFCTTTGEPIMNLATGRSIWWRPFPGNGGGGEVRYVAHLYCPGCGKEPKIKFGTPIYEDELVKIEE